MPGFAKYEKYLRDLAAVIGHLSNVLDSDGLDALSGEVTAMEFDRLPSVASDVPGKELAKGLVDDVRCELKPDGILYELLRWTMKQWTDGCRATLPHAKVFVGLVEEFGRRYREEKTAAHSVDFADLERLALGALLAGVEGSLLIPSPLARAHHRRFKHVLVDEYQDINEVQDAILSLVSRECVCAESGRPSNLFCVGDVKQSIYRFRLAEPARFLEKQKRFREPLSVSGTVIDLQANFRSRGPLLEAINGVFARIMTEEAAEIAYDASHHLRPGATFPDNDGSRHFTGAPIELHLLPKDDGEASAEPVEAEAPSGDADDNEPPDRTAREAVLVARRIRELMGLDGHPRAHVADRSRDGAPILRPIEFRDIVILLRSLKYKADQFADVLRRSGIPVHSESGTGYFESMEVRDMLALLSLLDNQRQDVPFAAVLRSPLANLPEPDTSLARIRLAYGGKDAPPFHQAVVRYANEHTDELAAKLRDFLAVLQHWRNLARRRPLAELIWTVYDRTGYLAFCAALPDGQQRSANLLYLHERARQFGTFQKQGLARFLTFLEQLQDESDLGQPSVATAAENVVRVMSVHRSKGLEFPVVICPDLGKKINLSDCSGAILTDRRGYLGLSVVDEARRIRYPSLATVLVQSRLKRQSLAEELRVLYVAMTRAKEHLILLGTAAGDAADDWRSRWARHCGAMPAEFVLSASCMLDWLGPVAAAMEHEAQLGFSIISHTAAEVATWPNPEEMRPALSARQKSMARLEPLDPEPPANSDADHIVRRLVTPYAHQPFTTVSATVAATELSKHGRETSRGNSGSGAASITFDRLLRAPRAVSTELTPAATDIGSATHLVLQHLDFSRPCDAAGLKAQIDRLVKKRLITPASAELVDLPALEWFAGTELGQRLRANASRLRREWPVYYGRRAGEVIPGAPPSDAPLDQVMIRSRVDVLMETDPGLEIIDYKTDRVSGDDIAERTAFYRPQMDLYRDAIAAIVGKPLRAVHLVFLVPRVIVTT
jgi:ATP-dependent helicase/nuclease subunit A